MLKLYLDEILSLRNKTYLYLLCYDCCTIRAFYTQNCCTLCVRDYRKAGINTKIFLAYALCSALTSAAYNKAFSLSEIKKANCWENFSEFRKFHNKPINVDFRFRNLNGTV